MLSSETEAKSILFAQRNYALNTHTLAQQGIE